MALRFWLQQQWFEVLIEMGKSEGEADFDNRELKFGNVKSFQ